MRKTMLWIYEYTLYNSSIHFNPWFDQSFFLPFSLAIHCVLFSVKPACLPVLTVRNNNNNNEYKTEKYMLTENERRALEHYKKKK